MTKYCIVDFRMRKIEKDYINSLGYEIIENGFNLNTYDEISAHPDIYYTKINEKVFCEPTRAIDGSSMVKGESVIGREYPEDVAYNVAIIGNNAVHNFKYTDKNILEYLKKEKFNLLHVEQGYSKCSICVLDEKSCITSDIATARCLIDAGIDVLYVSEPDIKLLKRTNTIFVDENRMRFEYSKMQGFIGGALVVLGEHVILFGDIKNLINGNKIKKFIESKNKTFHYFEGIDVIDYGGVIEVEKYE